MADSDLVCPGQGGKPFPDLKKKYNVQPGFDVQSYRHLTFLRASSTSFSLEQLELGTTASTLGPVLDVVRV